MTVPDRPKIYHIVHVDRLASIIHDCALFCDARLQQFPRPGTVIGVNEIKQRRLHSRLTSYPDLCVGQCVPFYFCPRSVMLYMVHRGNHRDLNYRGGQEPIIHLEADLNSSVAWAKNNNLRWVFTLQNAGSAYFDDHCSLTELHLLKWEAINAKNWSGEGISSDIKVSKLAEFLMENYFPWNLIERIGVFSPQIYYKCAQTLSNSLNKPELAIKRDWYY